MPQAKICTDLSFAVFPVIHLQFYMHISIRFERDTRCLSVQWPSLVPRCAKADKEGPVYLRRCEREPHRRKWTRTPYTSESRWNLFSADCYADVCLVVYTKKNVLSPLSYLILVIELTQLKRRRRQSMYSMPRTSKNMRLRECRPPTYVKIARWTIRVGSSIRSPSVPLEGIGDSFSC